MNCKVAIGMGMGYNKEKTLIGYAQLVNEESSM